MSPKKIDPFLATQPDAGRFSYDPGCPSVRLDDAEDESTNTRCCTHSHCVIYTAHPSGLCAGHRAHEPRCTCPDGGQPIIPHGSGDADCARCRLPWFPPDEQTAEDQTQAPARPAPIRIDLSDPALLADPSALIVRVLTVPLIAMFRQYGIAQVLEATADALTELARSEQAEGGEATGPLACVAVKVEKAREYAREKGL